MGTENEDVTATELLDHARGIEVPEGEASKDNVRAAFRTIAALKDHAVRAAGAWRDLEDAADDLRQANATLTEELRATRAAPVGESGRELVARYMDGDRVRAFSAVDPETKIEVPGYLDDEPVTDLQRETQLWIERRNLVRQLQRIAGNRPYTPHCDAQIKRLLAGVPDVMARAFADASGAGAEWIPDQMLPVIEREVQYEYVVANLFGVIPVTGETALLPYLSAGFIPYLLGEISGDDPAQVPSSTATTAQRSYSIKTFAARAQVGENAAEDAILPVVDAIIRPELMRALVIGEEDAIVNGDTSTHQDTGLSAWNPDSIYPSAPGGGSNDHRRAFIGLRARAADVSNTTDRSTFSASTLRTDLGTIKGPKNGPGGKVHIAGSVAVIAMMGLTETVTVDKFGPRATILTGQIGAVHGVPIVESQMMTSDLNASGVYDDTTKTKSGLVTVNTSRFKRFVRRGARLRVQGDITRGVNHLVVDRRATFGTLDGTSTKNVHFAYNMA